MQLKNKVAIVTGSGQGIGLGIAIALAKEGCNIVVSDINPDTCEKAVAEISKLGVKAIATLCNVAKKEQVVEMIDTTMKEFGQLDILVNNAGIFPFVTFDKMSEADWDKVMDVNMKGVFFCTSEALKVMKKGSRIITISSIASFVGFEGLVHYCASKSGVNGFTRALALELAPKGITVNAVAPGAIETPGATGALTEEMKQANIAQIPAKRMGTPEDIANAVVYLASDGASYVTGQVITVDGGWIIK